MMHITDELITDLDLAATTQEVEVDGEWDSTRETISGVEAFVRLRDAIVKDGYLPVFEGGYVIGYREPDDEYGIQYWQCDELPWDEWWYEEDYGYAPEELPLYLESSKRISVNPKW